jgi:hypothetical protein
MGAPEVTLRRTGIRSRRKPTGFDRPTQARIFDRDGHACVVAHHCDGTVGTAQTVNHIENRGMGGSSDPAVNTITNGFAVCHADNGWLEDFPVRAYGGGWKRRRGLDPAPVLYPDGLRYWLRPDGTRRRVEEAA